ncbi:MAG: PAS-domain containing protein [Pseudomonadota bacterium]
MLAVNGLQGVLAGVALALLVAGAAWALFTGLRARRYAAAVIAERDRLATAAAVSPALAVLVRADGKVEAPARLADWLGLATQPRYLADLTSNNAGLNAVDAATLGDRIAAAQKAARGFALSIVAQRSNRTLAIRGERAPAALQAPGGVLLWVFDQTDSAGEAARLGAEAARLGDAFAALTGLIEAAPMPMWYRAPDLRLTMVNSAYVTAVEGSDAAQVIARGVELVEGSGIGGAVASAAAARDAGTPGLQTLPATIGGERRMLRIYDVPLPTGGVAGFAVDIEDLEQARAGIKRFGDAQRAMLDRLSAAVAQFGPDRTLVFSNQPFQRMFGLSAEWTADAPEFDRVLEAMREAKRLPEVRDFPGWRAERRDWFLNAGAAVEEQWHLPGGTHLRVVAQPLPEGGLLLIFEDRTEQVQLAGARDTLLRVRTATFDNLFEALGVFSADGRLQLWNNRFRKLWGLEESFLGTHPRIDAMVAAASERLANPKRAALIAGLVRSAAVDRQQRGGRVEFADGRHFEFAGVPLPDGNALFTMLDISDSRRIERALRDRNDALEAADKVKTDFVANMSYELRTPLTSISGFAEMLHGGYAGKLPKTADDYVEGILQSVARLGTLVDDVLDLTQDATKVARAPVDLEALGHAAAEAVAPAAQAKGLSYAIEIDPSAGSVAGDADRLRQAVEHLLRHAVGEVGEGGRVLLHIDGDEARARIVVSDDGPGLSEDRVAAAFDRFAQPAFATPDRALGLGLPLARQFVEAHGGTIRMLSELGAGTLVTVELPRG